MQVLINVSGDILNRESPELISEFIKETTDKINNVAMYMPNNNTAPSLYALCQNEKYVEGLFKCFKERRVSVCEKAVETFGVISQLDQAQEEAAELIVAISKYKRALESRNHDKIQKTKSDILSEIADMQIMSKQLMILTGYKKKDLQEVIQSKVKKLYSYIKSGVK